VIRLVTVELTRLRWRRAVVVLVGLGIVFAAVLLGARAYDTRPFSDADVAEAQRSIDENIRMQQEDLARCKEDPDAYGAVRRDGGDRCEQFFGTGGYVPSLSDYLYREMLDVSAERTTSGLAVAAVLAVLMLLAGTTYVGHDWNTGSMSNQLLFEPRRLRVWAAKAVAVALVAAVTAVVALAVFWGGLFAVAATRDVAVTGQVVTDVLQHAGRSAAMVVVAAVGGYALTTLTRSTVFTIAALAVISVAGGIVFGLVADGDLTYEPATNAAAVVNGRVEFYRPVPPSCYDGLRPPSDRAECDEYAEVTQAQGAVYYGVVLLLLGGASAASYRRRDVP
jgi:hypothetical protein